jgi:protein ImuB
MYACIHAPGNLPLLVECARKFSPSIEETSPDTVLFDVRGLESLYGPPPSLASAIERQCGIPASIAIAANPDAAAHAARGFRGITVIAPGDEARTLAPLPLNLLSGTPETARLLHLWGIRTFGELAKLPPLGVAARLGEEGSALQRLAQGAGYRRLHAKEDPLEFEAALELEDPVELLEALSFVLARLLNEICVRLTERAMAANEIHLRLALENAPEHVSTLRLPVPMLDSKTFLKMLLLDLNARPPAAAVLKVHLRAEPSKPRRTQQGLFLPSSPEPEKLELTLARIRHLTGADHVGAAELLNTHQPDRFVIRPFSPPRASMQTPLHSQSESPRLSLRRFRPPRYTQVLLANRQPIRIASPSVSGPVAVAKGPWRTAGNWWNADAWNRDEWDVEIASAGMYRLFQEIDSRRWFLEGSYD